MKPQGFDLRYLVLKKDLEFALSNDLETSIELLNQNERKIINEYCNENEDVISYIRELLLNLDFIKESEELFISLQKEVVMLNPDNKSLVEKLKEYRKFYLSCIENGTGNKECIFLPRMKVLK